MIFVHAAKGMTSLLVCLLEVESLLFVTCAVLPFAFDHLRGSEGTIVVVVSPLLSPQSQLGRKYIAF